MTFRGGVVVGSGPEVTLQPLLVDQAEFHIYAAVSALLVLWTLALALSTAAVRGLKKSWTSPEDVKLLGGSTEPDALVERIGRAHRNTLENVPLFLVIGLLFVAAGAPVVGIQAYGYTFLIARVLHSVFYLLKLQPFRTLCYVTSVACLVGMSVQVLMHAFG